MSDIWRLFRGRKVLQKGRAAFNADAMELAPPKEWIKRPDEDDLSDLEEQILQVSEELDADEDL